jgi:hypothetical protein
MLKQNEPVPEIFVPVFQEPDLDLVQAPDAQPKPTEPVKEYPADEHPPADLRQLLKYNPKPRVLTIQEAEEVHQQVVSLLSATRETRVKLGKVMQRVEESATAGQTQNTIFAYNPSKRPKLHLACRALFGVATGVIDYRMYRHALDLKRQMERDESDDVFREEES